MIGENGTGPNEVPYVVDSENHAVRKIDLRTRVISTVVGHR